MNTFGSVTNGNTATVKGEYGLKTTYVDLCGMGWVNQNDWKMLAKHHKKGETFTVEFGERVVVQRKRKYGHIVSEQETVPALILRFKGGLYRLPYVPADQLTPDSNTAKLPVAVSKALKRHTSSDNRELLKYAHVDGGYIRAADGYRMIIIPCDDLPDGCKYTAAGERVDVAGVIDMQTVEHENTKNMAVGFTFTQPQVREIVAALRVIVKSGAKTLHLTMRKDEIELSGPNSAESVSTFKVGVSKFTSKTNHLDAYSAQYNPAHLLDALRILDGGDVTFNFSKFFSWPDNDCQVALDGTIKDGKMRYPARILTMPMDRP